MRKSESREEDGLGPQTNDQRKVESRINDLAGEFSRGQGVSRRNFLFTAAGMATAFLAMNEVYGDLFDVSRAKPTLWMSRPGLGI
ncbi:MAG: hypothetical protein H0U18_01360 [Pyrinomonadaceae bacterium]|nr:hypothetical protein [Pyrinomonadaceae bacterium]